MSHRARPHCTRRELLRAGLRGVAAWPLLALLGERPRRVAAQPAAPSSPRVRLAEIVQRTRDDFAGGQLDGVELPRAGGEAGLTSTGGAGTYTSAPLPTEFTVSHVGLHWVATAGEPRFDLRSSLDGMHWSPWRAVTLEAGKDETPRQEAFGALIGARGARWLQYRAIFPARQRCELRQVALTCLDSRSRGAGVLASPPAGPSDFRATIVSREEWGADESLRFGADGAELWPRAYVPARQALVHHTATSNDYGDGAAEVRAIYTYHAQTLGWGDIGYHLLIDSSGRVYEGRRGREVDPAGRFERDLASRDVVAGHAVDFNYGSAGVALLGNFNERALPPIMRQQLEAALVFLCGRSGVDPLGRSDQLLSTDLWRDDVPDLAGHRDCTPTECPGDYVYPELTAIREAVSRALSESDRPRAGPVRSELGRDAWPGRLDFVWSGPRGAEYSVLLEGWRRLPGHDDIIPLHGYDSELQPLWGDWSSEASASFEVPLEARGHYTLHVRARLAPGYESVVWSRSTVLLEPQVSADNADSRLAQPEGIWRQSTQPLQFYGRDFAFSPSGEGGGGFRWRLVAPRNGRYVVQACWPNLPDFATAAPFAVFANSRLLATVFVDQTVNGARWQPLTEVDLAAGQLCELVLGPTAEGTLAADAVRLLLTS